MPRFGYTTVDNTSGIFGAPRTLTSIELSQQRAHPVLSPLGELRPPSPVLSPLMENSDLPPSPDLQAVKLSELSRRSMLMEEAESVRHSPDRRASFVPADLVVGDASVLPGLDENPPFLPQTPPGGERSTTSFARGVLSAVPAHVLVHPSLPASPPRRQPFRRRNIGVVPVPSASPSPAYTPDGAAQVEELFATSPAPSAAIGSPEAPISSGRDLFAAAVSSSPALEGRGTFPGSPPPISSELVALLDPGSTTHDASVGTSPVRTKEMGTSPLRSLQHDVMVSPETFYNIRAAMLGAQLYARLHEVAAVDPEGQQTLGELEVSVAEARERGNEEEAHWQELVDRLDAAQERTYRGGIA